MANRIENPRSLEPRPTKRNEAYISPPTTFKELGIESRFDRRLNLGCSEIVVTKTDDPDGDGAVYLTIVRHPFLGKHFTQFLDYIAPFKGSDPSGVAGDLRLPFDAKEHERARVRRAYTNEPGEDERRHSRHTDDPVIGPLYREFVAQNATAWYKATNVTSFDPFFNAIESLRTFDLTDHSKLISEARGFAITSFIPVRHSFSFLSRERKHEVSESFMNLLTEDERYQFALDHIRGSDGGKILIDFAHREMEQPKHFFKGIVDILDDSNVQVKYDPWSGPIEARVRLEDPQNDIWIVTSYEFSSDYVSQALFPLIAWRKTVRGDRSFLSQQEALPLLWSRLRMTKSQRDRLDVAAGKAFVAAFSPDDVDSWRTQLALAANPDVHQKMMGAQVAVWVSHPDNVAMLLSDNNPVLPVLEKVV